MQATEEPDYEKNHDHQAEGATEPRSTISSVPVIAAAAAKQQNDQEND